MIIFNPFRTFISFLVRLAILECEIIRQIIEIVISRSSKQANKIAVKSVTDEGQDLGSAVDEETSTNGTPSADKRIKLLVDISISPDGSRVLNVSSQELQDSSSQSKLVSLALSVANTVLAAVSKVQGFLVCINHYVDVKTQQSLSPQSPGSNGCRKMKSPKRRIPAYRKILPHFPFRILGMCSSPENLISLPSGAGTLRSPNSSKTHACTKRKHSDGENESPNSSSLAVDACEDVATSSTDLDKSCY